MRNIKEILEDYPSLKLQYEQMENMSFVRLLLKKDQRKELDRIKKEMKDLIMTTEEYNNNFSDYGWIAYSLINVEFMKNANIIFKENGIEKAEDFISDYYKDNIIISIMNQYTIIRKLEYSELNDKVDEKEYDEIINYAYDLGVRNAFIQEDSSQSDSFIPSFKGDMII